MISYVSKISDLTKYLFLYFYHSVLFTLIFYMFNKNSYSGRCSLFFQSNISFEHLIFTNQKNQNLDDSHTKSAKHLWYE